MIVFPNCKINLGLHITGLRNDGYHNLETVFYPLPLCDVLESVVAPTFNFSQTGLSIAGDAQNNLCVKAFELLKKKFPEIKPVTMHLHKVIPMGAGLGGGSADGAFALLMFNKMFDLQLFEKDLIELALQLGSDCPFFIINQPCFSKGRGELLEKIDLDLSEYKFVLVYPGINVNTREMFGKINPSTPSASIKNIISRPVEEWKEFLKNDFEEVVFEIYPEIGAIKNDLYKAGAVYASMSGSGSSVYGLFKKDADIKITFPESYLLVN